MLKASKSPKQRDQFCSVAELPHNEHIVLRVLLMQANDPLVVSELPCLGKKKDVLSQTTLMSSIETLLTLLVSAQDDLPMLAPSQVCHPWRQNYK